MSVHCATRVLARYLAATALLTPKEALAVFKRYAPRIESQLSEPAKAAELYHEMAGKLQPMSQGLAGVVIQRKDEQRKLENLKKLLRAVERATAADSLRALEGEELESWIRIRLENLEETLKSLVRTGDRLTEYAQGIPRSFLHGKYTIVNRHGFRPEETQQALAVLDEATAYVDKAGFRASIYGDVVLESPKGVAYAGKYTATTDTIQLNVAARKRFDSVYTLVHEIGHRVWHKLLSEQERDTYEDQYFSTATRAISLQEREAMWEAFLAAKFNARQVRSRLPTELRELWSPYWSERGKAMHWPTPAELANPSPLSMSLETMHRNFVRPKQRYVVLDESVRSVTDYGKTNVQEDFAEVFAHYCSGKPLTVDAKERFRTATGRG